MNQFKNILFLFFFLVAVFGSKAQNIDVQKLNAKDFIKYEDYNRGLEQYLKLYKKNQDDIEINYYIGLCYTNINVDKSLAIPHFKLVEKSEPNYNKDLQLHMGRAYMYAYKFDTAITYLNNYRKDCDEKEYKKVDRLIANCEDAKVLIKSPIDVSFENLGKQINTKYPDYYPFVVEGEGIMYFTSRRNTNIGNLLTWQGYFSSDIYYSKVRYGSWTKAKNLGPLVNSAEDEQCVHVSQDGSTMVVYKDDAVNKISGDLFLTKKTGRMKTFPRVESFGEPINLEKNNELEGYLYEDENIFIFASDREGTVGEMDLFMVKKLPNGKWAVPMNLGPNINTEFNEAFPLYDEANQTLYFSSEGHINMGGYDIFKSKYDEKTGEFGPATNIGYPINTPEDNMEFTLMPNKRDGYTSAVRPEGFGDLDIYRVIFNKVDIRPTVLNGYILTSDSTKTDFDVDITLIDFATKDTIETRKAHKKTGRYIFAVDPGKKYTISISSPGYLPITEDIPIFDKSDYVFEREKSFTLVESGSAPIEE